MSSYSCSDFTDSIIEALNVDVPDCLNDDPSAQADLCIAEIERLQECERRLQMLGVTPLPRQTAEDPRWDETILGTSMTMEAPHG